jgi:hypothetical protein
VLGGGLTLIFISLGLDATQQGYYYTFGSLLALQVFFELGLNQIVVQLVSHEVAHLDLQTSGMSDPQGLHWQRLIGLVMLLHRWYGVAALAFAVLCGAAGAAFLQQRDAMAALQWLPTWCVLVLSTAANLWLSPHLAVLEGCGKVGQVARLRMWQSMAGYGLLWLGLVLGVGLWVAVALPLSAALCTWLGLRRSAMWRRLNRGGTADAVARVSWRREIFPLQWRMGLSWMSGYLIFHLFTPLVFAAHGAVEAGRLGMALAVFSSISTVGMSWVNAKTPDFTRYIARSERTELNALFARLLWRSTLLIAVLSLLVVAVVSWAGYVGWGWVHRLAEPRVLWMLAGATVLNGVIFAMALYMRAHREEPMLWQSLGTGVLVAVLNVLLAERGVLLMVTGYALVVACIALPWTWRIWLSYRHRN